MFVLFCEAESFGEKHLYEVKHFKHFLLTLENSQGNWSQHRGWLDQKQEKESKSYKQPLYIQYNNRCYRTLSDKH